MNEASLRTYLNDHLAGSAAGRELAEQCAASNPGTPLGAFMRGLASKIDNEQEIVKDLLERLGGEVNPVKSVTGWLGEKASRLKLNNPLQTYLALDRLEQIEGILLGVRGKLALWTALEATVATDARFGDIDFDELSKNADQQLAELELYRLAAARDAFSPGPSAT